MKAGSGQSVRGGYVDGLLSPIFLRRWIFALLCIPILLISGIAHALGLGDVEVRSALGRPLRLLIPVIASGPDEIGCVQILPRSDELPAPENMRSRAISTPRGNLLEITTLQSVSDPAIGLRVSVGCAAVITRDYVVFLDPPQTTSSLGEATPPTESANATLPPAASSVSGAPVSLPQAAVVSRHVRPRAIMGLGSERRSTPRPRPERARPSKPKHAAMPEEAPVAARNDRLVVSSDLSTPGLRISPELSQTGTGTTLNADQQQQLNLDRARLAAYLTDTNPDAIPNPRELEQQKKLDDLSSNVALLHQQLQALSEQNRKLSESRLPQFLTWLFGLIALISLALAAWIGVRYRRAEQERRDHPWWEQTQLAPAVWTESDHEHPTIAPQATLHAESDAGLSHGSDFVVPKQPVGDPSAAPIYDSPSTRTSGTASAYKATTNRPTVPPPASAEAPSLGWLDERVSSVAPPSALAEPIDFNLDLPETSEPIGAGDEEFVFGTGPTDPLAPGKPVLAPLAFNFSASDALPKKNADQMGPDTILRMDDDEAPHTPDEVSPHGAEQASVQFRLIQFAAIIDQAEELRRKGAAGKAIALLRQYVLRDETIPTQMWLLLFSLYKQVNKRPVYEALADHFGRRYRRQMALWDEPLEAKTPQLGLSLLPDLETRIQSITGTQAGIEFLRTLTCGRDQSDDIVFNSQLQRDLLQLAKVFPLDDSI